MSKPLTDYSTIANLGRRLAYHHTRSSSTAHPTRNSPIGVLFCGGFKSNMQGQKALAFESYCQSNALPYTRFDYSGHGNSEGQFTEGDIGSWLDDALCIFDNVACASADRVVVIGSSMGAWIATLLTQQRKDRVAGLLTLAAAPDFTEKLLLPALTAEQLRCVNNGETITLPSDYDDGSPYPISAHLINQSRHHCLLGTRVDIDAPVRLIHGTGDSDVPYSLSIELMNSIQSTNVELTLIKDADHRLSSPDNILTTLQTLEALLDSIATQAA